MRWPRTRGSDLPNTSNGVTVPFGAEVMRINRGSQLHFLDLVGVLMLLRSLVLLGLLVTEFPVIHDAANRRLGRRGNLDKVNPVCPSQTDRLSQTHHSQLTSIIGHNSNLSGTDSPVDP